MLPTHPAPRGSPWPPGKKGNPEESHRRPKGFCLPTVARPGLDGSDASQYSSSSNTHSGAGTAVPALPRRPPSPPGKPAAYFAAAPRLQTSMSPAGVTLRVAGVAASAEQDRCAVRSAPAPKLREGGRKEGAPAQAFAWVSPVPPRGCSPALQPQDQARIGRSPAGAPGRGR